MPDVLSLARRRVIAGVLLLALVALVGGRHLVRAGTAKAPPTAAAAPLRAEAPPKLLVHVVGAVRRPGLYRLPGRSRTADALERAGGATRAADLSLLNLAAPVADGMQVVVPARQPEGGGGPSAGTGGGAPAQGPVHLNTASLEELDALPGVGPVTAQKILDFRQKHGAFASVDDLDAIPGIGPARLEQLREVAAP
ncbi:MAG TPA: ComEA family DNA-binding protein [Gaiellaceae bacterium]|nr:ComEA family DNA-binding protein [Gaiellaceae bacterium]